MVQAIRENRREIYQDAVLGACFVAIAAAAAQRVFVKHGGGGSESVIKTLYSLILLTAAVRAIWFLIPSRVLEPSYAPQPGIYAFQGQWLGTAVSELLLTAGTVQLFAIFILFAIYWSNLVKKIFKESAQTARPMFSFWCAVAGLCAVQALNLSLFLGRAYSSQGMILADSVFLSLLALLCSVEVSLLSHRFRTVLMTLGAVNQVSTEIQVRRIVWITVSSNAFLILRAAAEGAVAITLLVCWKRHQEFGIVFNSRLWEWYILIKHFSEVVLLAVILFVLNGKFGSRTSAFYSSSQVQETPIAAAVAETEPLQADSHPTHTNTSSLAGAGGHKGYNSTGSSAR